MARGSGKDQGAINPRRRGQGAPGDAAGAIGGGDGAAGAGGAGADNPIADSPLGALAGREPVIDITRPDTVREKKRGMEYGWLIGVPDADGWQEMALLSITHRRAGAGAYFPETNSPAAYIASLVSVKVKEDTNFPGSIMTEFSVVDPRREILLKVGGDRYSKKQVAIVAADALELVTGTENAFHSLDDYSESARREPVIRANPGPDIGGGSTGGSTNAGASSAGGPGGSGSGSRGPASAPGGTGGNQPAAPPRDPADTSFSQPDRRFRGPAYNYLRKADKLPTYDQIADQDDPVCRVKLFSPSGRFTYYVAAATNYEDQSSPIVTGYALSPLGPDADEWGDTSIGEIAAAKAPPFNLPVERDIGFKPMRLSEIRAAIADGKHV